MFVGPNSPFSKISLIDSILQKYKINEIVNNFLVVGEKCMPDMNDLWMTDEWSLKKLEIQNVIIKMN